MAGTYIGTTHNSKHNGHGPTVSRTRFAIKSTVYKPHKAAKSKSAPWYIRPYGHLSTRKRERLQSAAEAA